MAGREHKLTANLEEWLLQGTSLTPGLAPSCDRHPFGADPARRTSSLALQRSPRAPAFLRDVLVLLVVGFGRRGVALLL